MTRQTPPPAKPACVGKPPEWFDTWERPGIALTVCESCPVRAWCLEVLDPIETHYEGIAGGHAWYDGKHRAGDLFDPVLDDYLRSNPNTEPNGNSIDPEAVRNFIEGNLSWEHLNTLERTAAAKHLVGTGMAASKAAAKCHLNWAQFRSHLQEAP